MAGQFWPACRRDRTVVLHDEPRGQEWRRRLGDDGHVFFAQTAYLLVVAVALIAGATLGTLTKIFGGRNAIVRCPSVVLGLPHAARKGSFPLGRLRSVALAQGQGALGK